MTYILAKERFAKVFATPTTHFSQPSKSIIGLEGCFGAPCERTFQRVQVPNPPDSGKDIAEHQGCPS